MVKGVVAHAYTSIAKSQAFYNAPIHYTMFLYCLNPFTFHNTLQCPKVSDVRTV